jgi:hypothetical protein
VGAASIWAVAFVGVGLGGQVDSTSASGSATSVDSTESVPVGMEWAGAWIDVTAEAIGDTAEWTNKVELADINGDGSVDLLFANGGDYETAGTPVLSRAFVNGGDGTFAEATGSVLGDAPLLTRVIKVGDVDADGNADIVVGTTYDTRSRLLLGTGDGSFTDVTGTNLPTAELSAGDLELGDVDGDDDLDIVIADWGDGSPFGSGGVVTLWLNDGAAVFSDATAARMPATLVGFSWDLELIDVDNDWDLDVATSCKNCPSSLLYVNDGAGTFSDVTAAAMPAFSNNYEFAPIDLDGDGFLDLVTINDGAQRAAGLAEHVFRNDGTGAFVDVTDEWWPAAANPGWDDNVVVALDIESDGDADFLIGSLDGPDRLLVNDGSGALTMHDDVFFALSSGGTLGMAVADLNGDDRPDVVESQGEVPGHEDERVYLATDVVPADTAAPIIRWEFLGGSIVARVHDNRTPNSAHDWRSVIVRWTGGEAPMTWYGENLFRARVAADVDDVEVCATDAAGNETCTAEG